MDLKALIQLLQGKLLNHLEPEDLMVIMQSDDELDFLLNHGLHRCSFTRRLKLSNHDQDTALSFKLLSTFFKPSPLTFDDSDFMISDLSKRFEYKIKFFSKL